MAVPAFATVGCTAIGRPTLIFALVASAFALATFAAGGAVASEIVDLGPATAFEPLAINNSRVIVSGEARDGANHALPARLWDDGTFVDVPTMDAVYANSGGKLYDINDANLVVGTQVANFGAPTQLFEEPRAFTWQYDRTASSPAPLTVLQQFGGWGPTSIPYAVNSAGDVVGLAQETQGDFNPFGGNPAYDRAVIWRHGSALLQRLETGQQNVLGDPHQGYAIAINDSGTILGVNGPDTLSPVMWTPIPLTNDYTRTPTPARSPETNPNNPNGQAGHPLNNRGQYITTNDGTSVNWHRYDPDGSSIPLPAGFSGRAIADNGRIVGIMANHATLVEPIGIAEDLNDRNPAGSPFSTLSTAEDINDAGDVIGIGLVGGVKHGYLLKADAWLVNDPGDDTDTDADDGQCLTAEGRCTLRSAIAEANATPGSATTTIAFSISGDPTISPDAALPPITRGHVAIDGRTQSGGTVTIDGSAVADAPGLRLRGSDITVKGLRIRDFADGPALEVGSAGSQVSGVTIGGREIDVDRCARPCNTFTDNKGAVAVPNAASRVRIVGNVMTGDGAAPIDLGADGRTANDRGDLNGRLNFPVGVTGETDPVSGDVRVSGAITPAIAHATIDVYAQPTPGAPATAAPARYLGETVTSDTGAFSLTVAADDVDAGQKVYSATATIGDTTSELSAVCGDPVVAGNPDADGDGLCDSWELAGVDYDGDGTSDLTLADAQLNRKDLYLEVDGMAAPDGHRIAPTQAAIDQVVDAFDHAPVDGGAGVALHVERDEDDVPYADPVALSGTGPTSLWGIRFGNDPDDCTGAFGAKAQRQSPQCWAILGAKRLTTRYALFTDNWSNDAAHASTGSSGVANGIGGDALIVSEAPFGAHFMILAGGGPQFCTNLADCSDRVDAETLMHEFGHLLGLRHGGSDDRNYKPNYLSIMSYGFQFATRTPDRPLDYSRWALPALNPGSLDERLGILGGQSFPGLTSRWPHTNHTGVRAGRCQSVNVSTAGAIDFDLDGTIEGHVGGGIDDGEAVRQGYPDCQSTATSLDGFDDWAHLRYNLRDGEGFQKLSGAEASDPPEDTEAAELAVAAQMDSDGDGRTNFDEACAVIPGAPDVNGNGVLDDCEGGAGGGGGGGGGGTTPPGGGGGGATTPPGGGGAGTTPPSSARDITPPSVGKAKARPARFRVARKGAKKPASTLTLTISEPGTLTITVERLTKGHRTGKRCSTKTRRGKPCTITVRQTGTLTAKATRPGTVTIGLTGRLANRALHAGRYNLLIVARDAAGNRSTPVRVAITIR